MTWLSGIMFTLSILHWLIGSGLKQYGDSQAGYAMISAAIFALAGCVCLLK